ncbi:MAG TPA: hypothetical protein VNA25_09695 [Phycisphaerae bacterium]|nr:hypothetical protein [Phycisphaerae bacterium]
MPGDPPERKQERAREPIADDFRAAEEVLARLMPSLDRDAHEYHDKQQALAQLRAKVGKDRFDLRYGLRPPRDAIERAEIDLFQGRITQDQFREACKADAERPIDIEMLDTFCNAYEDRLQSYSRMLQTVIAIATDQREPDAWCRREAEVDRHVEEMKAEMPLQKEQVGTVFTFLAELRADRNGEPVQCGGRSAESAHRLADVIMDHAVEGWRSGKKIAEKSRTDPSYLYPTSASHLFYEAYLPGLPRPNDLMSLMVLERARARKAIQEQPGTAKTAPSASASINIQAEAVNVTTPSVNVAGVKPDGDGKPARRPRMRRGVAEPLIREHLLRRPHDTAEEVAEATGCSVGLVAESAAWKANQDRLKVAAKEGRDPKAVKLDLRTVNAAGGNIQTQKHAAEEDEEALDTEIDKREQDLGRQIGDYLKHHPDATPQEVARALCCTAGEVELRQAALEQLIADQAENAEEDGGGKYIEKKEGLPQDGKPPKRFRKRV